MQVVQYRRDKQVLYCRDKKGEKALVTLRDMMSHCHNARLHFSSINFLLLHFLWDEIGDQYRWLPLYQFISNLTLRV